LNGFNQPYLLWYLDTNIIDATVIQEFYIYNNSGKTIVLRNGWGNHFTTDVIEEETLAHCFLIPNGSNTFDTFITVTSLGLPIGEEGDLLTISNSSFGLRKNRLPKGTTGQVLTVDSGGVGGLNWSDPSGFNSPLTTKGDLLTMSTTLGVTNHSRLAVSLTNGQVLTVDSTEPTGLKWATPSTVTNPPSAKGEIWTHNGTSTFDLPVGTNGQVLTADSSTATGLKWDSNIPYQVFSTKTANYTVTQSDHGVWIQCNTNNVIITLPNGLTSGTQVIVDRLGTATVTFAAGSGTSLVGKSTAIASQYGVVHCTFNGTSWRLTGAL
jgi:hypothetical protein